MIQETEGIREIQIGEIIKIDNREYLIQKAGVGGHKDKYKISLILLSKLFQGDYRNKRSNKFKGVEPTSRKNTLREQQKKNNLKLIKLSNVNTNINVKKPKGI